MKNREIAAAWSYHDGTKHSQQSIRANPHYLDWEIQPFPFKIFPHLEPLTLNQNLSSSEMPALEAISHIAADPESSVSLTRQTLAELLFLSAGITKRRSYPGGEMLFRAAACTGALYHIDLYLVCGDLADIEAGVYHFSPNDFALRPLRHGDYRGVIIQATGAEASLSGAPGVLICASTFWRNAWKYQSRTYRHCYWDNGTILANLLAAASARAIYAKVVLGFVDAAVRELLSLDGQREAALSIVALGHTAGTAARSRVMAPLALETAPLSKREIDYPAIRAMHQASSLESEEEVVAWRADGGTAGMKNIGANQARAANGRSASGNVGGIFPLQPLAGETMPQERLEEVIIRRGSTRRFSRQAITFAQLSTMLDRATRGVAADVLNPQEPLNALYLIVNAVDGIPAGAYVYHRPMRALELLKEGDFRSDAGYLGLGQAIPADCSVNIYFLSDLHRVLERFGNRGYRAAQLEASIMGGKIYLAAYAQRLGASGLTFFDDEVTEFFSPSAAGKSVMFLVAVGKSFSATHTTQRAP
jgi:SagB-type dehydrogenase family enzyme